MPGTVLRSSSSVRSLTLHRHFMHVETGSRELRENTQEQKTRKWRGQYLTSFRMATKYWRSELCRQRTRLSNDCHYTIFHLEVSRQTGFSGTAFNPIGKTPLKSQEDTPAKLGASNLFNPQGCFLLLLSPYKLHILSYAYFSCLVREERTKVSGKARRPWGRASRVGGRMITLEPPWVLSSTHWSTHDFFCTPGVFLTRRIDSYQPLPQIKL